MHRLRSDAYVASLPDYNTTADAIIDDAIPGDDASLEYRYTARVQYDVSQAGAH